jgi:hypothetical protein
VPAPVGAEKQCVWTDPEDNCEMVEEVRVLARELLK